MRLSYVGKCTLPQAYANYKRHARLEGCSVSVFAFCIVSSITACFLANDSFGLLQVKEANPEVFKARFFVCHGDQWAEAARPVI
jgi:hypothetical protein